MPLADAVEALAAVLGAPSRQGRRRIEVRGSAGLLLPACNGIIIEALRRLFTLAVAIAAVFVLVHVWTNKGLDRHQLPGPKIIEIDPGKNIP